jgi:hypothetical protein
MTSTEKTTPWHNLVGRKQLKQAHSVLPGAPPPPPAPKPRSALRAGASKERRWERAPKIPERAPERVKTLPGISGVPRSGARSGILGARSHLAPLAPDHAPRALPTGGWTLPRMTRELKKKTFFFIICEWEWDLPRLRV